MFQPNHKRNKLRLRRKRRRAKRTAQAKSIRRLLNLTSYANKLNAPNDMMAYLVKSNVPFLLIRYYLYSCRECSAKYELVLFGSIYSVAGYRMLSRDEFVRAIHMYGLTKTLESANGCIYEFGNFKELYNRLKRCSH